MYNMDLAIEVVSAAKEAGDWYRAGDDEHPSPMPSQFHVCAFSPAPEGKDRLGQQFQERSQTNTLRCAVADDWGHGAGWEAEAAIEHQRCLMTECEADAAAALRTGALTLEHRVSANETRNDHAHMDVDAVRNASRSSAA